ncbi:uncharacterized protein VTP21DRAFT_10832 [Calcarisporiella thermophila]|uniref:uncharacterized protein n=1 Tax=Calcarisporiella thermophila TaxID=911321 RepID=UPI003742752E
MKLYIIAALFATLSLTVQAVDVCAESALTDTQKNECILQQQNKSVAANQAEDEPRSQAVAESGSWCYKPSKEKFWGQSTGDCCDRVGGSVHGNRRCYGLQGSKKCRLFYECCINKWGSKNGDHDGCY